MLPSLLTIHKLFEQIFFCTKFSCVYTDMPGFVNLLKVWHTWFGSWQNWQAAGKLVRGGHLACIAHPACIKTSDLDLLYSRPGSYLTVGLY